MTDEKFLTRSEMTDALRERGFPVTLSQLNKLCAPSRNEGPKAAALWPDGRAGHDRPLYRLEDAVAWARARLKQPETAAA